MRRILIADQRVYPRPRSSTRTVKAALLAVLFLTVPGIAGAGNDLAGHTTGTESGDTFTPWFGPIAAPAWRFTDTIKTENAGAVAALAAGHALYGPFDGFVYAGTLAESTDTSESVFGAGLLLREAPESSIRFIGILGVCPDRPINTAPAWIVGIGAGAQF